MRISVNYKKKKYLWYRPYLRATLCTLNFLSVNVFSTKVLIGDTIFTSRTGDGTAILRGHPSHAKV